MSIYAKNNGTWVPVGPAITVSAEGTPGAPTILNPEGGSVIKFTAAPEGGAGPNLAHGASISPNNNGEFVTVDQDNLEVAVLGTTPFTDYVVSIYGVNEAGRGEIAKTDAFQLNYNDATGGTEAIVDNYNGTGEKWKVHTFTGNGTFTVKKFAEPSRVLLVGGGGDAGSNAGGGGGGGQVWDLLENIENGSHIVTVGQKNQSTVLGTIKTAVAGNKGGSPNGGKSGNGFNGGGGSGGNNGGGGGGAGAAGTTASNTQNAGTGPGGAGVATDITGSSQRLGGGGGGGGRSGWSFGSGGKDGGGNGVNDFAGRNGTNNTGGGGGGGGVMSGHRGGYGGSGVVIVAYQIGTSTTRQIQQAQAEEAARQAGVEQGIEQGKVEGYAQAQEDIQEELSTLRTQIAGAAGTTETMLIDGKEQEVKRTRKGRRR